MLVLSVEYTEASEMPEAVCAGCVVITDVGFTWEAMYLVMFWGTKWKEPEMLV